MVRSLNIEFIMDLCQQCILFQNQHADADSLFKQNTLSPSKNCIYLDRKPRKIRINSKYSLYLVMIVTVVI